MYEPVGTVDHFLSWHHDPSLAYEWDNYRFASGWINSSKQTADGNVLDPYDVADGWFEIILPSPQLRVTDRVQKKTTKSPDSLPGREQLSAMRQQFFAARPDSVVSNAHEAVGQGVQHQAARWRVRFSVPSGRSPPEQTR